MIKCLHLCFHAVISFSIFSERRSLKIENDNNHTQMNNSMKTLTAKVLYKETRVPRVQVYIETNSGWLELPFTGTKFHGPSLFKP